MSETVHALVKSRESGFKGNFPIDSNVIAELPSGSVVVSANSHGSSAWTRTARVDVNLPNGTPKAYFLKVATEDAGKVMMEGEFNSMTALYAAAPAFVPKPLAWGRFRDGEIATYFFISEFIDMSPKMPEPIQFCARLAQLHRDSVSPTGQFGFHITTCHGKFPQAVSWDSNWASFFTKLLSKALEQDLEGNGPWKEYEDVAARVIELVIPRLLGILQKDGRVLKPCLIHGDLWEGNIGTDFETDEIYIFDAGAYYAHNEMEIGMWRCERHRIKSKTYRNQYLKNFGISEPVDEWDDRNRLYSVKMNIVHSAHHAGSIVRETAFNDMTYLVGKYAPWPEKEAGVK